MHVAVQQGHFDHMLLDKPVDKFLESRRHCCNWQVWIWAQQRRMEQVFIWRRRWFHAFHIIHVRRRLHRRASCHQAATPVQPAPLDPEWLQTQICTFAAQSFGVLPINLSVKWQKIRPMILARSKTCQTDLKRKFLFASVNPQSTGQCSKHLEGGRTHGSCLWVSDLQSRNLAWFIFISW